MHARSRTCALAYITRRASGVQVVGYLMKVTGLVSPQMEGGISSYVGFIGLPCLLFRVTATLDLSNIRPLLVFSLLLAKVRATASLLLTADRVELHCSSRSHRR